MPSGMFQATLAIVAISCMLLLWSGEPLTKKLPSAYSTSASAASRRWAASNRAFSFTLRAARTIAAAPTAVVRLP